MSQLDKGSYDESELIEIKIPLNLPYLTSQSHYERVDGELQHKGVYYNYVERKVNNDTLYLRCRPNTQKTNLYRDLAEYTRKVNDIPSNGKSGSMQKKLSLAYEYMQTFLTYSIVLPDSLSASYHNAIRASISDAYKASSFKPPRNIS